MKVITWNVNSIRVRIEHLQQLINLELPDLVLLQELKVDEENFPKDYIEKELGYHVVFVSEKQYNGVAILSKYPFLEVKSTLPNIPDNTRYIEALIKVGKYNIRVATVYVPNGNSIEDDKFQYKLDFLGFLTDYLKDKNYAKDYFLITGDFNITPTDLDAYDAASPLNAIFYDDTVLEKLNNFTDLGLYDSYRVVNPDLREYSYWDYRKNAFKLNRGMRIDFIYVSKLLKSHIADSYMFPETRSWERPSDHVPVITMFRL